MIIYCEQTSWDMVNVRYDILLQFHTILFVLNSRIRSSGTVDVPIWHISDDLQTHSLLHHDLTRKRGNIFFKDGWLMLVMTADLEQNA